MRRLGPRAAVLAVLVLLVVLTSASAAWAFGGAAGEIAYVCPFAGGDVQAQFWAQQTSAAFDGCGHEVIDYGIGRDTVSVAYARVVTLPGGVREAYFAGPVVRSTLPGISSYWWYMAARDAPGTADDRVVGRYVKHNAALATVATGGWVDYFTTLTATSFIVWR